MHRLAALAALAALLALPGCAGVEDDASGDSAAVSSASLERVAGAFATDYALGSLAGQPLVDIPENELADRLPEGGDARRYAQCLAARHDVVKGDTLEGKTWDFEEARYYALETALEDANGLHDLHMLFVFASDGTHRFSVLAWDGRKNVQITYRHDPPCV